MQKQTPGAVAFSRAQLGRCSKHCQNSLPLIQQIADLLTKISLVPTETQKTTITLCQKIKADFTLN